MKKLLAITLTLAALSFSNAQAKTTDTDPNYETFKENIRTFKDRLFQNGIGKLSKEDWTHLKKVGRAFTEGYKHQVKYDHNIVYRTCYNFTTIVSERTMQNPEKIKQIARDSNLAHYDNIKELKQIASATFEIYVDDYKDYEYEQVFFEFFLHANEFNGMCIDELFASNIYEMIIAYNSLYPESNQ
ncbi:MAG TPA: hypothetical protein DCL21_06555 [Alphaproteobacteria bacterium]|nr:hypothetical protein [Alphaproteobacteria bacterium]